MRKRMSTTTTAITNRKSPKAARDTFANVLPPKPSSAKMNTMNIINFIIIFILINNNMYPTLRTKLLYYVDLSTMVFL